MIKIVGFGFSKISAEKMKKETKENVKASSNLSITEVEEEKIADLKDSGIMRVNFDFTTTYDPDFAKLVLSGTVITSIGKDNFKEVLKEWKEKRASDKTKLPILNLILAKCNLKCLQLEEELGLPMHFPMPRVEPEEKQRSYTG